MRIILPSKNQLSIHLFTTLLSSLVASTYSRFFLQWQMVRSSMGIFSRIWDFILFWVTSPTSLSMANICGRCKQRQVYSLVSGCLCHSWQISQASELSPSKYWLISPSKHTWNQNRKLEPSVPAARLQSDKGCLNTLRPRQDGRHFADNILKCIF